MVVDLNDGRSLRVFVTNTYHFTNHTLDRVLEIDPSVNAIICSCPAGQYVESAKAECIQQGIGLFMLAEFMGAIRLEGEAYLNFLVRADKEQRVRDLGRLIAELRPAPRVSVYAFGSYLRRKVYNDIDLIIIYRDAASRVGAGLLEGELIRKLQTEGNLLTSRWLQRLSMRRLRSIRITEPKSFLSAPDNFNADRLVKP